MPHVTIHIERHAPDGTLLSTLTSFFSITASPRSESSGNNWSFTRLMGFSFIASLLQNQHLVDSAKLLVLGTLIETGRRLCQWLMERFQLQYCITAQFDEGDPAYEWIVLFLTQENVWRRSRDFRVNAKNSQRKWGIQAEHEVDGNADYVPTYEMPQLFRWKGYWVEIKRNKNARQWTSPAGPRTLATMIISIYTLDMNVLSSLVAEARTRYQETSRPNVTVHMADMPSYGPGFVWSSVKHKARRPLSSIILMEGVLESLVKDAQEFIDTEDWYTEAGIPYRRGYLLYGPPGTGKTSTIYALAGELGLEIFALPLSSGFVDDAYLQKAASSIPKNSILLIEDIDCAFPSRDDADEGDGPNYQQENHGMVSNSPFPRGRKSAVTLSGLLNVLDGIGSEEGKLFFATTNYVDKLDPALLRPGRIDKKIQYKFATQSQASALFRRFFGRSPTLPTIDSSSDEKTAALPPSSIGAQAQTFASSVPEHEFSTAELQGFLLRHKKDPAGAVACIGAWVSQELTERREKEERERERKAKLREKREEREARQMEGTMAKLGGMVGAMSMYGQPGRPGMVGGIVTGGLATPSPAYDEGRGVQVVDEKVEVEEVAMPVPVSAPEAVVGMAESSGPAVTVASS
ncbi:Mitochondrial chaperone BCS1 [Hypsizygus marmoreus]|uniref:Mitochondrial chaperone BCS1 n=1 Tax=Hypsizygus marmoreus TaxID=39966 RepID=A0A369JAS8_HYPMA|nr:Mitochondrial chaperone BCS1 [Hypsizygus marmoreus]